MATFELIISLLVVGAFLAAVARKLRTPYPVLLAGLGAVLAFAPNVPDLTLDPELQLALFVAPVLLDAAYDASLRDLRDNWRPVAGLALVAVGLTIICVAYVTRWLVPAMPWPVAIALGAIVAPPDASAATAVLSQLRPPHRVLVILEGESLFNDVWFGFWPSAWDFPASSPLSVTQSWWHGSHRLKRTRAYAFLHTRSGTWSYLS